MSIQSMNPVRVMRRPSKYALLPACGVVVLSLFVADVQAQEEPVHKTVKYHDLDLSDPNGAASLYRRLQAASKSVCGEYDTRNLALRRVYQRCYQEALSNAVAEVNNPAVTALHGSDPSIRVAQRRSDSPSRT